MSIDNKTPEKSHFTIKEVADTIKESTSLIRFWEKKFTQIRPQKDKNGVRVYTEKDLKTIIRIHNLVKIQRYTLKGASIELNQMKTIKQEDKILEDLKKTRSFLQNLLENNL